MKVKLKLNNAILFQERLQKSLNALKMTPFRASGPGGQHRNKVSTAVRYTDPITGFVTEATDSRSQEQNKASAFKKMANKLIEYYSEMDREEYSLEQSNRDERIRTYNEKRNEVVDHRTGVRLNYNDVLDGKIDEFITSAALGIKNDE